VSETTRMRNHTSSKLKVPPAIIRETCTARVVVPLRLAGRSGAGPSCGSPAQWSCLPAGSGGLEWCGMAGPR
jgi:hypothetical protein